MWWKKNVAEHVADMQPCDPSSCREEPRNRHHDSPFRKRPSHSDSLAAYGLDWEIIGVKNYQAGWMAYTRG